MPVDVTVENHGSIWLFRLHTEASRGWVGENVAEPMWHGAGLACEARHAMNLAQGMIGDGLNLA